jgi:hypothetical protein
MVTMINVVASAAVQAVVDKAAGLVTPKVTPAHHKKVGTIAAVDHAVVTHLVKIMVTMINVVASAAVHQVVVDRAAGLVTPKVTHVHRKKAGRIEAVVRVVVIHLAKIIATLVAIMAMINVHVLHRAKVVVGMVIQKVMHVLLKKAGSIVVVVARAVAAAAVEAVRMKARAEVMVAGLVIQKDIHKLLVNVAVN